MWDFLVSAQDFLICKMCGVVKVRIEFLRKTTFLFPLPVPDLYFIRAGEEKTSDSREWNFSMSEDSLPPVLVSIPSRAPSGEGRTTKRSRSTTAAGSSRHGNWWPLCKGLREVSRFFPCPYPSPSALPDPPSTRSVCRTPPPTSARGSSRREVVVSA